MKLVATMLGKELDDMSDIKGEQKVYEGKDSGESLFEAEGLQSNAGIKPFDFYIKKGEVNGFTGLLGSGPVSYTHLDVYKRQTDTWGDADSLE